MPDMSMTVNVHDAAVKELFVLDAFPANEFGIDWGNSEGYGNTVTFFMTDERWDAIVAEVAEKRAIQRAERIRQDAEKIRCAECNRADQPTTMETDVCDECVAKLTGVEE